MRSTTFYARWIAAAIVTISVIALISAQTNTNRSVAPEENGHAVCDTAYAGLDSTMCHIERKQKQNMQATEDLIYQLRQRRQEQPQ